MRRGLAIYFSPYLLLSSTSKLRFAKHKKRYKDKFSLVMLFSKVPFLAASATTGESIGKLTPLLPIYDHVST
jgi:hypothetical protein